MCTSGAILSRPDLGGIRAGDSTRGLLRCSLSPLIAALITAVMTALITAPKTAPVTALSAVRPHDHL
ncbi:hypothetical protein GCM10023194_59900 [Planotetraspora phitsanulokensis]|uniref:Uncharacterized protein n=1 Tax=Planotetraspora phitsanulokensis TaxID=575192 RepID=A0A8J3XEI3_9ACTN|nr:hypothetical protein Pph01_27920 [Planotetraspora phitsanulokensis]